MNTLVLRMFEFARHPTDPVDVFFMAVDKETRALFADYNFTELFEMTEPGSESPEYLMYLDTHSPEYQKTIAFLKAATAGVESRKNNAPIPMTKAIQFWKYNPAPSEFSGMQKESYGESKMLEFRQAKKKNIRHLQFGIHNLEDNVIKDPKAVAELTEWISSLSQLPDELLLKLKNLTESERQALRDNVEIFSNDFLNLARALNASVPSRGRIYIFGAEKNSLAEVLTHQYPEREIHFISSLENLPIEAAEAVLIVDSFSNSSKSERIQLMTWARSVLQKHRQVIMLETTSTKRWPENQSGGPDLKSNLLSFAQSAFSNGATPTEAELVLSLAIARLYFEKSISTPVQEDDIRTLVKSQGFTVDINLPHRISWVLGGQLQGYDRP